MITIKEAFLLGLKSAWANKKWVFVLYAVNVIVVWLLSMPVTTVLEKGLAYTTAAGDMLAKFDLRFLLALIRDYGRGLSISQFLFGFGVIYVLLNTLISGGIINSLHEHDLTMSRFFSAAAEYFTRFLRLVGFSILGVILVIILFVILSAISSALLSNASTEVPMVISFFIRVAILILFVAMLSMIFDYARIMTVVNDFYGMTRTLKNAFLFVMMSFRKTAGLYLLFMLAAFIALGVYWILESSFAVDSAFKVFVFVVLSQLYMLLKMFIRLGFITSQFTYYHFSNTAKPGMTPEMLEHAVEEYEQRVAGQKEA